MNTRIRNGIFISIAGIVVVLIGIFFLTRLVSQSLAPLPAPAQPTPILGQVVVANRDLALGELISEGDIKLIDAPVEISPRNTIPNLESVYGRLLKVPLVQGEMVLTTHLADPTNINHDQVFLLGDNQVLMAFQPGDLMTSLGIPKRGDIVDLLISYTVVPGVEEDEEAALLLDEGASPEGQLYTFPAFQLVEITAMVFDVVVQENNNNNSIISNVDDQPASTEVRTQNVNIESYLLGLTPQDALLLKYLVDTGATFDLVLRNPASTSLFNLTPITKEYLVDKYGIKVAP